MKKHGKISVSADHTTNTETAKELTVTPVLHKIQE
jgi:hypothetical protein